MQRDTYCTECLLLLFKILLCFFFIQEGFDGQMTEDNIEIGVCDLNGFRRLDPADVKDYLAAVL